MKNDEDLMIHILNNFPKKFETNIWAYFKRKDYKLHWSLESDLFQCRIFVWKKVQQNFPYQKKLKDFESNDAKNLNQMKLELVCEINTMWEKECFLTKDLKNQFC